MKTLLVGLALMVVTNRLWTLLTGGQSIGIENATGGADGSAGASGGAGGAGGAGGGGSTDYAALAAAIQALADGTQLPNIQSVTISGSAGSNQVVAGEGGKALRVLAYAVTTAGANNARFRSGASTVDLWRVDLDAPAGKSGANLATAFPSYLFSTASGDALSITLDGAASVSVTYWQENQ